MNCHRTTGYTTGRTPVTFERPRCCDHGADINAVDEEFRSTPLGFAARWGHYEMVRLLLERRADPKTAGAGWATPFEWARKKGHTGIEADLR
jgi:uncharacterized protein